MGHCVTSKGGPRDVVARAGNEARKRLAERTRDPHKIRTLDSVAGASEPYCLTLLSQTQALHRRRFTERSSLQGVFDKVCQTIDQNASIGDVLVQDQAQAAWAWGIIRAFIRFAVADLEVLQCLDSGLVNVAQNLTATVLRLSQFPGDNNVFESSVLVFESILGYLVASHQYMTARKPFRAYKAITRYKTKLKTMFAEVALRIETMDRFVGAAETTRSTKQEKAADLLAGLPDSANAWLASPEPAAGTCDWVLSTPEMVAWESSGCDSILFIEGGPGCGKSVLARRLCSAFDHSFNIFHDSHKTVGASTFMDSALAQLLQTNDTEVDDSPRFSVVMKHARLLHEKFKRTRRMSPEMKENTILSILSDDAFSPVTIIVDSFGDAGNGKDSDADIARLRRLAQTANARVIILTHNAHRYNPIHWIKMTPTTIAPDVEIYVRTRVMDTAELRELADDIMPIALTRSSGMFLYAKLLLDDLESADNSEDCLETLKGAPRRLEDYYHDLWQRHDAPMTPKNRLHRNEIFLMLLAAGSPLHMTTISQFMALDTKARRIIETRRLTRPGQVIGRLCRPFVHISGDLVQIAHPSMENFIQRKMAACGDPNAYLAEKCLLQLSDARYSQPMHAAAALRRHILDTKIKADDTSVPPDPSAIPYDYAVLHWQDHVTNTIEPTDSLLELLQAFITSIAVVSWAERLVDLRSKVLVGFLNVVLAARTSLEAFISRLKPSQRHLVDLEVYFVKGHETLRSALTEDDHGDHLLPYLPSFRLGAWYTLSQKSTSDQQSAYDNKGRVVEGFSKVLGRRNPLTLEARISWVNEFWFRELIEEAVNELKSIVDDYKQARLEDTPSYFEAVQNLASGNYFLGNFDTALELLRESGSGLLTAGKEKEWIFQVNNWIESITQDRRGELELARGKAEAVLKDWAPIAGDNNGLSLLAKDSLGSIYRKQEEYSEAKSQLLYTWNQRYKQFTIENRTTVDSGLHLAMTFREAGELDEAEDFLRQVKVSKVISEDCSRRYQATHIQSLILFDRGDFNSPLNDLVKVVEETAGPQQNRDRNNREAMWVRTTAADALRAAGRDSDALVLFAELVKPRDHGSVNGPPSPLLSDEPEPASQLKIAETAVRLVKEGDKARAEKLLADSDLQWVRPKDFWLRQGVAADTAWMKPPKFDGFEEVAMPAKVLVLRDDCVSAEVSERSV